MQYTVSFPSARLCMGATFVSRLPRCDRLGRSVHSMSLRPAGHTIPIVRAQHGDACARSTEMHPVLLHARSSLSQTIYTPSQRHQVQPHMDSNWHTYLMETSAGAGTGMKTMRV